MGKNTKEGKGTNWVGKEREVKKEWNEKERNGIKMSEWNGN